MDKRLAEAMLATLRGVPSQRQVTLERFGPRSWKQTYHWLDASGLALYFLDQITRSRLEDKIPEETLARLQQNQRDNCARTEEMFREFVKINTEFQHAGLHYLNLKGVSLAPDYFDDPNMRFQLDLDFLVDSKDTQHCSDILRRLGYRPTGVSGQTREFKAGGDSLPRFRDMYKPKPQRSVEVHFTAVSDRLCSGNDDRIERAQLQSWNGFTFAALCEGDKFLAQSMHLYGHLRSEWTRAAWALEYRNYIYRQRKNGTFWNEVKERAKDDAKVSIAIGMASRFACKAFGECEVPTLDRWTREALPKSFNLWIDRYTNNILLADFPGTKLYLLLDEGLPVEGTVNKKRLRKLVLVHPPQRVVFAVDATPLRLKWNGWCEEIKYFLFRLRFHIATGLRYVLEAPRWKRVVIESQQ